MKKIIVVLIAIVLIVLGLTISTVFAKAAVPSCVACGLMETENRL